MSSKLTKKSRVAWAYHWPEKARHYAFTAALILAPPLADAAALDIERYFRVRDEMAVGHLHTLAGTPDVKVKSHCRDGSQRWLYIPSPVQADPQLTVITIVHDRVRARIRDKVFGWNTPQPIAQGEHARALRGTPVYEWIEHCGKKSSVRRALYLERDMHGAKAMLVTIAAEQIVRVRHYALATQD